MMVRVPGQPAVVRVYAEAEHDEAVRYAAEVGVAVVVLRPSPAHRQLHDKRDTVEPPQRAAGAIGPPAGEWPPLHLVVRFV